MSGHADRGQESEWAEVAVAVVPTPEGRRRGLAAVVAPFAVAALFALVGATSLALIVAAVGSILLVLRFVRPGAASKIERFLAWVGHQVASVLSVVLLGLAELVVFLPLAVLARLFRRDPLAGPRREPGSSWVNRSQDERPLPARPYAPEAEVVHHRGRVFRWSYLGVRIVGWVLIVGALNYGVGWVWDEYFGTHDLPVAASTPAEMLDQLSGAEANGSTPWSDAYWEEFGDLDYEYHPYILSTVVDVEGRYIRSRDGVRVSYEPDGLDDASPEVWFFGGAAMWGQGQRDAHTIASEVARAAEADGTDLRVVNFGQPGYTSWQAALLLEQQLAVRPAPDVAVFYDGAADVAVQLEHPSESPTHHNVAGVTPALTGRDSAREQAWDWWEDYRQTSVLGRALDRFRAIFGAQPAAADGPGLAERVADLHGRSVDLASFVAGEHGIDTVFAWQAAEGVVGDEGAYRRAAAAPSDAAAVDLTGALDDEDRPVYLDGVLTNERGALVVAADLWALLRPVVG